MSKITTHCNTTFLNVEKTIKRKESFRVLPVSEDQKTVCIPIVDTVDKHVHEGSKWKILCFSISKQL